jgi:ABC-type branched-subunit amino acid transport system ATPase component
LNVNGLSLSFGGLKALTNVSFSVEPGSITAVIGPNGAGKTSLFNCISGFYRPSSGAIEFDGEDISKLHPPSRARIGLARTFQNIALFRGMTVLDNIKLGRHAHMKTNVLDALWYLGAPGVRSWRCDPRSNGASSIFLRWNISAISRSLRCPMACASVSSLHARLRCSRAY